jgi:hypothetical protein
MAISRVRIMQASAALQVSLPGYNVETTTLNNMAFDARFANMTVFMRTQVQFPELYQQNGAFDQTVFYPEALSRPPLAFVRVEQLPSSISVGTPNAGGTWVYIDRTGRTTLGFIGTVGTSSMTLRLESFNHPRPSDNFQSSTIYHLLLLRP